MVPAYNSEFWRMRAEEARGLADQMNEPDAKAAMLKVAEGYERIRLRRVLDEGDQAFNEARKALSDNVGSDSQDNLTALRALVDDKWAALERARQQLEAHIQAYPQLNK